jgi:hypothetical protein
MKQKLKSRGLGTPRHTVRLAVGGCQVYAVERPDDRKLEERSCVTEDSQ